MPLGPEFYGSVFSKGLHASPKRISKSHYSRFDEKSPLLLDTILHNSKAVSFGTFLCVFAAHKGVLEKGRHFFDLGHKKNGRKKNK